MQTVSNPPDPVKSYIVVTLTDGEHIHDTRVIHPDDYGRLNEEAQTETEGELWWAEAADFVFDQVTEGFTNLQTIVTNLQKISDSRERERCFDQLNILIYRLKRAQRFLLHKRFGATLPWNRLPHPDEVFGGPDIYGKPGVE